MYIIIIAIHAFFTVFGFVEPTFTAEERVEPYNEVRLAFLSGMGAFGAFRVFIIYQGGTASE